MPIGAMGRGMGPLTALFALVILIGLFFLTYLIK